MGDEGVPGLAPEVAAPQGKTIPASMLETLLGLKAPDGAGAPAAQAAGATAAAMAGPAGAVGGASGDVPAGSDRSAQTGQPAPATGASTLPNLSPGAYLSGLTGAPQSRAGAPSPTRTPGLAPSASDYLPPAAAGPGGPPAPSMHELAPELEPDVHGANVFVEPERPLMSPMPEIRKSETSEDDYQRGTTEDVLREDDFSLPQALMTMLEMRGSDLHLSAGAPPTVRVDGALRPIPDAQKLTPPIIQRVMYAICTQQQRERFEEVLELDFSYALPGVARFRVNMYKQRDAVGGAFRVIPFDIKSLEQLGMPPVMANFAALPRGFVVVTGPTGSGKSTTLAALVDLANRTRAEHIMTVEDPIEFLHHHKKCLVNQREVGQDTTSFSQALKHVLRQDPDIILVGEMRDLETIQVALTAAETGHLVYATLHTQDAAQTIDRVIDVFPPGQQQQIRQQLAGTLQAIICQTLCKTTDGHGRVAATEVLVATAAIRNLIREGKTHQIYSALQAGAQHGMHTLDQQLADLVKAGKISMEVGYEKCHHVEDFVRMAGQQSRAGQQGRSGQQQQGRGAPARR